MVASFQAAMGFRGLCQFSTCLFLINYDESKEFYVTFLLQFFEITF